MLAQGLLYWRILRRMSATQGWARVTLQLRFLLLRRLGLRRLLPRRRLKLADDWATRVSRVSQWKNAGHDARTIGFHSNSAWRERGAGRAQRYGRELPRLELFYHRFLNDGSMSRVDAARFLEKYLSSALARAGDGRYEWHPYAVSNRLANWIEFLATPEGLSPALANALANECLLLADFVEWMQEQDLKANHWLKNLWAVALADAAFCPELAEINRSATAYTAELSNQLNADGGHYEHSPMYHGKVLLDAMTLQELLPASVADHLGLATCVSRALEWNEAVRMTPSEWPDINDSWHDSHVVAALSAPATWTPRLGVQRLTASGLIRGASAAGWRWLFDVGDVSPAFNPGHSHSDVLSLMLHWANEAILIDPGVLHYSPNDERRFLRSCHAHNGPCLASEDHTELAGSFRVGRSVGAFNIAVTEAEGAQQAQGSYCYPQGAAIHRHITVAGGTVRVVDTWRSRAGSALAPWVRFLWAFEFAPLEVMFPDANSLVFTTKPTASGARLKVSLVVRGAERPRLYIGESFRSREFGRTIPATETVFTATRGVADISVETSITRLMS